MERLQHLVTAGACVKAYRVAMCSYRCEHGKTCKEMWFLAIWSSACGLGHAAGAARVLWPLSLTHLSHAITAVVCLLCSICAGSAAC